MANNRTSSFARAACSLLIAAAALPTFAGDCDHFPGGDLSGDNLFVTLSKMPGHQLRADWAPQDLVPIPTTGGPLRMQLRREAAAAFGRMQAAAAAKKIEFKVRSGYRSFERQCKLYKIALQKPEGQIFTAHPGRSEHQLGTTVDIGTMSFDFQKTPAFHWLMLNAHTFGFTMSYSEPEHKHDPEPGQHQADNMNPETGYAFEPWHWRYIGVEAATRRWGTNVALIYFLVLQNKAAPVKSADQPARKNVTGPETFPATESYL